MVVHHYGIQGPDSLRLYQFLSQFRENVLSSVYIRKNYITTNICIDLSACENVCTHNA